MADIELKHSAKGTSWIKRNHLWVSRKKVNGKWVYTYKTEKGHKDNVRAASERINTLNKKSDAWNLNKKEKMWRGGSSLSDNVGIMSRNVQRATRRSKSIGSTASKANVKALNREKQKAYSDYESQKRMAVSAAGAATRSNKYKNDAKRRKRKLSRKEAIARGKAFVRDVITKLTDKKKYAEQQLYKKRQELKAKQKARKKMESRARMMKRTGKLKS